MTENHNKNEIVVYKAMFPFHRMVLYVISLMIFLTYCWYKGGLVLFGIFAIISFGHYIVVVQNGFKNFYLYEDKLIVCYPLVPLKKNKIIGYDSIKAIQYEPARYRYGARLWIYIYNKEKPLQYKFILSKEILNEMLNCLMRYNICVEKLPEWYE